MRFKSWLLEAHHHNSSMIPLSPNDTILVFHGFDDMIDAIQSARSGFSGRLRAPRKFSYESNNNPKGLFVTIDENIARRFTDSRGCVIGFVAKYEELEPPVWPTGGYAVQGQFAPSFKGPPDRIRTKRKFENEFQNNPNLPPHIKNSKNPYLAYLLFESGEKQALFIGNLNPNRIMFFSEGGDSWKKQTLEEFLEKHKDVDLSKDPSFKARSGYLKHTDKLFLPEEDFSGEEFIKRFPYKKDITSNLGHMADRILNSEDHKQEFLQAFNHYIWPNQYTKAFSWLIDNFAGNRQK